MVFAEKTFGPENQIFPRENQKNKKNIFCGKLHGLFGFPEEKNGFSRRNQLFTRKKMVLGRNTNFFLSKTWFWVEKPIFSQEKDGFGPKNPLFSRKKMVLDRKTNFS